jgi:hypothetical protein
MSGLNRIDVSDIDAMKRLMEEYVFALICEAATESFAAENEARVATMTGRHQYRREARDLASARTYDAPRGRHRRRGRTRRGRPLATTALGHKRRSHRQFRQSPHP